jgi:hypothetical protein
MSCQIPIRKASAATLLSLVIFAATEFTGAQTSPMPQKPETTPLSLPLVSTQQMTPEDRAAAQSWQPAIASSAQFFGYTLDSSYAYREIACPVAPHHLLLAYEATAPNGYVSRFTAVIRREAETEIAGRAASAQIIPILHFGIVPFIPAIANPHSIEIFNAAISSAPSATEVLSADQAGNQPLLVRTLCYLAMVGEEPAALTSPPSSQATIHASVPTLVFQNKGKIRQLISVRSSPSSYQVWALTFQSGGNLLTATRQEHPIDRTPLVLNAAHSGSSPVSSGTTTISIGAAQVSSPALTPMQPPPPAEATAAVPVAATEPIVPSVAAPTPAAAAAAASVPAPPVPPDNPPAMEASTPVAPSVAAPRANITNVEPVAPAAPAMATPPPPQPSPVPTPPEPVAAAVAVSTPQPPVPPAPAAISTPSVMPAAAWIAMPPVVKLSPPLPPDRLIQNLPQPPSRIIPDSALKTPPHLQQ